MAAKLGLSEVRDCAQWLENDAGWSALRSKAESRYEMLMLRDIPPIPEWLSRGLTFGFPSPMLINLSQQVLAEWLSYQLNVTVSPRPREGARAVTQDVQTDADAVEAYASAWLSEQNSGHNLDRAVGWHLLNSPFSSLVYHPRGPGKSQLEAPHPLTCYFPATTIVPGRPDIFVIRDRILVRDALRQYGSEREGWMPEWRGGKWQRVARTQGVPVDYGMPSGTGKHGAYETVERIYLADQECTYHLLLNRDSKTQGDLLYAESNVTEGIPVVIGAGLTQPMVNVYDRLNPFMLPLIQITFLRNFLRTLRANRSAYLKPDIIVELDPEKMAALQQAGLARLITDEMVAGQPGAFFVGGKPFVWTLPADGDLDLLEQSVAEEGTMYINALLQNTSPEVVAQTTASAYLTFSEAHHIQQTPLLQVKDFMYAEATKMCLSAAASYHNEDAPGAKEGKRDAQEQFTAYAAHDTYHGEKSKKVGRGAGMTLNVGALADLKYEVYVATRSETESDQRRRLEDQMVKEQNGYATHEQGLAILYSDVGAQVQAQAVDAGLRETQSVLSQVIGLTVQRKLMFRGLLVQPPVAPQPTQPVGEGDGGGAVPMAPASLGGAGGGGSNGGTPVGV